MSDFYDNLEIRPPEQREAELFTLLSSQVAHAQESAPAVAELLADVDAATLVSRSALEKLPLLYKSDLIERQKQYPVFGGLAAVDPSQLGQIFASPGPIFEPGARRPDFWRFSRALHAAGLRRGEIVQNCFSYHFTPAGMMFDAGAQALGCAVVPAGVGQTELQVQVMGHVRPQAYVGTPSFLKLILEKADKLDVDISCLNKALVSGEYLPPSLRESFSGRGIAVLQCYATADLGLISYESSACEGMIVDEGIILEIVRPGTGDPVPEGEVGEVVVTSLSPEYPLIRFATGDLSAFLPGESPCGRTNRRIKGWMGRADQTTKIRGMFVRPTQVAEVLRQHPEIIKGRLIVERIDDTDSMVLHCELAETPQPGLAEAVVSTIRQVCNLRGEVIFAAAGSLANDGKVIDDLRPIEA